MHHENLAKQEPPSEAAGRTLGQNAGRSYNWNVCDEKSIQRLRDGLPDRRVDIPQALELSNKKFLTVVIRFGLWSDPSNARPSEEMKAAWP
ncbi:hypothetical protein NFI96_027161 [Prochilodus magdalenae]|nr:hypothetical protein NFI96_027161 [Prochilodus magdalenae]